MCASKHVYVLAVCVQCVFVHIRLYGPLDFLINKVRHFTVVSTGGPEYNYRCIIIIAAAMNLQSCMI